MVVVHHLDDSRSQRVLWLLEELGLPYAIEQHRRDPMTRLAPPELRRIHPLGKSPVISSTDRIQLESGAQLLWGRGCARAARPEKAGRA